MYYIFSPNIENIQQGYKFKINSILYSITNSNFIFTSIEVSIPLYYLVTLKLGHF